MNTPRYKFRPDSSSLFISPIAGREQKATGTQKEQDSPPPSPDYIPLNSGPEKQEMNRNTNDCCTTCGNCLCSCNNTILLAELCCRR